MTGKHLFIILIFCVVSVVGIILVCSNTKENLDLVTYTNLYLDATNKSFTALTSDAIKSCNNSKIQADSIQVNVDIGSNQTDYDSMNINIQNKINSISLTAIKNMVANCVNYKTNATNQLNTLKNITSSTYNIQTQNTYIRPESSTLNLSILPNVVLLNNLYLLTMNTYDDINNMLIGVKSYIVDINNLLTSLKNTLSNVKNIQTNLNTSITNINNQLILLTTAQTLAQNAVNITSDYSKTTEIQNALGSVFTTAQNNLNTAIQNQTSAIKNLNDAITRKASQTEISNLTTVKNNAIEAYKQAYQMVRFLINPENLVNDISIVDENINLSSSLNKTNVLNTFLKYFVDNNIRTSMFTSLSQMLNNSMKTINNTSDNITNVYKQIIPVIKDKFLDNSKSALNTCNTTKITLTNLSTTSSTNITKINALITNIQSLIDNTTQFIANTNSEINTINTNMTSIYTSLTTLNKYNIEQFYYPKDNTSNISIGTIKNSGKLVRLYLFVNINSSLTCSSSSSYFTVSIQNQSGTSVYTKKNNVNSYGDMTIELLESVSSIQVNSGFSVNVNYEGTSWSCGISSTNIQIQLEIDDNLETYFQV